MVFCKFFCQNKDILIHFLFASHLKWILKGSSNKPQKNLRVCSSKLNFTCFPWLHLGVPFCLSNFQLSFNLQLKLLPQGGVLNFPAGTCSSLHQKEQTFIFFNYYTAASVCHGGWSSCRACCCLIVRFRDLSLLQTLSSVEYGSINLGQTSTHCSDLGPLWSARCQHTFKKYFTSFSGFWTYSRVRCKHVEVPTALSTSPYNAPQPTTPKYPAFGQTSA